MIFCKHTQSLTTFSHKFMINFFLECNTFEFSDLQPNHDDMAKASNIILLRIRNITNDRVTHRLPVIDRCCKSSGWDQDVNQLNREFIIKDSISRIPCNISKPAFLKDYVMKRNCVILSNCTGAWEARKWTFKGKHIVGLISLFVVVTR